MRALHIVFNLRVYVSIPRIRPIATDAISGGVVGGDFVYCGIFFEVWSLC